MGGTIHCVNYYLDHYISIDIPLMEPFISAKAISSEICYIITYVHFREFTWPFIRYDTLLNYLMFHLLEKNLE